MKRLSKTIKSIKNVKYFRIYADNKVVPFIQEDPSNEQQCDDEKICDENRKIPTKRLSSDVYFLILNIIFFFSFLGFVGYCFCFGDFEEINYGMDSCGYICGVLNKINRSCVFNENKPDTRLLPILSISSPKFNMDGLDSIERRVCIPKKHFLRLPVSHNEQIVVDTQLAFTLHLVQHTVSDLEQSWTELLLITVVSSLTSGLIFVLLRYIAAFIVWAILLASIVVGFVTSSILAYKFIKADEADDEFFFGVLAAITCFSSHIFLAVVVHVRSKVTLAIELLRESGKVVASIPTIIVFPFLTSTTVWSTLAGFGYAFHTVENSGVVTDLRFIRALTAFGTIWYILFVMSCQDFVVAGASSKWFFSRNKDTLKRPVFSTFDHLMRFHLGSISLGSLAIVAVKLVRAAVIKTDNHVKNPVSVACNGCTTFLEKILSPFSTNAYIYISLDGTNLCNSGRKAYDLVMRNYLGITRIQAVGNFVFLMASLLISMLNVCILAILLQDKEFHFQYFPIAFGAALSLLTSKCFFSVYEMTIDTIFVCFCEDCEVNDGIDRPYFMSKSLIQFMKFSTKDSPRSN